MLGGIEKDIATTLHRERSGALDLPTELTAGPLVMRTVAFLIGRRLLRHNRPAGILHLLGSDATGVSIGRRIGAVAADMSDDLPYTRLRRGIGALHDAERYQHGRGEKADERVSQIAWNARLAARSPWKQATGSPIRFAALKWRGRCASGCIRDRETAQSRHPVGSLLR